MCRRRGWKDFSKSEAGRGIADCGYTIFLLWIIYNNFQTRFSRNTNFQTAAIISQKLVNWFCSNVHSIFSTYIATSWTEIIKIASLVFFTS